MLTILLLLVLVIVFTILGFCFNLVGGILKTVLKLIICLPCALIFAVIGVVLCCTLILIPLGIASFKLAGFMLNPFRACFA